MKYATTPRFDREFKKFPEKVHRAFRKQITFLISDIRHPSLRAKRFDETSGIWQARVTDNVRFFFRIVGDVCQILNIRKHTD